MGYHEHCEGCCSLLHANFIYLKDFKAVFWYYFYNLKKSCGCSNPFAPSHDRLPLQWHPSPLSFHLFLLPFTFSYSQPLVPVTSSLWTHLHISPTSSLHFIKPHQHLFLLIFWVPLIRLFVFIALHIENMFNATRTSFLSLIYKLINFLLQEVNLIEP